MNFTGIWINKDNNEQIKLSGPNDGDDYLLEYNHDGNEYNNSEIIPIYLSNKQHALLVNSIKFGRCDILILSQNRIKIGNIIYNKE